MDEDYKQLRTGIIIISVLLGLVIIGLVITILIYFLPAKSPNTIHQSYTWSDGNHSNIARHGYFVTFKANGKLALAQDDDDVDGISNVAAYLPNYTTKKNLKYNQYNSVIHCGVVEVYDNGLTKVGHRCSCRSGIAVPGDAYKIVQRISPNKIRIVLYN
jgi:hypothetical protein